MRNFFRNWYAVTITAAVLLAALCAFGLPLFVAFFRPLSVRIGAVVLVALAWGLWWYLRRRAARKAADAIAAELAGPNAADEEGKALGRRMTEALAKLRGASGGRRDYLYSRPWYVIIGPPGAGKTTALLNSGLRFPLSNKRSAGSAGPAIWTSGSPMRPCWSIRRAATRHRIAMRRSMPPDGPPS